MNRQQLICIKQSAMCWSIVLLYVACACFNSGCVTSSPAHYSPSSYNYSYNRYQSSPPRYYSPPVSKPQPQPQTIYEPAPSFTDKGATGSGFNQEYNQTIQREREHNINAYLYSCAGWGGAVRDVRNQMKASIALADRQLAVLRNKIIVAGGRPESNSNYIAAKAGRDNLARKLVDLDNRIMKAIEAKATGDVAKSLIWREEDKAAVNAAMQNLNYTIDSQNNETQRLLNQANW